MAKLKIATGQVALDIVGENNQVRGVFCFDPTDVVAAKRLYEMQESYKAKSAEFAAKAKELGDGNIGGSLDLIIDFIAYLKAEIDTVFGQGSSTLLFDTTNTVEMFGDFFQGITPYYDQASKDRMAKHTGKYTAKA